MRMCVCFFFMLDGRLTVKKIYSACMQTHAKINGWKSQHRHPSIYLSIYSLLLSFHCDVNIMSLLSSVCVCCPSSLTTRPPPPFFPLWCQYNVSSPYEYLGPVGCSQNVNSLPSYHHPCLCCRPLSSVAHTVLFHTHALWPWKETAVCINRGMAVQIN